ncbi:APC family permease [Mycolicibacterium thermoresistibile]
MTPASASGPHPELRRRLGTVDAVTIGLGSMIGAGIFVALGPAAAAAGPLLLIGLALAAVVAYCNATASARLAARYPQSGGTYVYGRERLGPFWGYTAGFSFIVGKTASCAAMALTVGFYLWPAGAHAVAVAAVVALTALTYLGIEKSALLTRVLVAVVLGVLAAVVVLIVGFGSADHIGLRVDAGPGAVLQAAGLLFFAFAGYARIATLGEEVRDPARTIPRAIPIALGITLVVYAAVTLAVLGALGSAGLATATAPLADAVTAAGFGGFAPVVRAGAVVAAVGALLALLLGVSRTVLAMARDRHLPYALAAVHPRFGSPHRAGVAVGIAVAVLAAVLDVRGAIGFSSFAVLLYYAITNAAAYTLGRRPVPVLGLVGCLVLAFSLPLTSVLAGVAVVTVGALGYAVSRAVAQRDR